MRAMILNRLTAQSRFQHKWPSIGLRKDPRMTTVSVTLKNLAKRLWRSGGMLYNGFEYSIDIAPCHLCNTLRVVLRCNASVTQ